MKGSILTGILVLLISLITNGQTPQAFNYQAVVRDSNGDILINKQVGMKFSILKGSLTGTSIYSETHTPTSNANGLINIQIGGGTGFDDIDWSDGQYFIKTETDPSGGTNYSISGTSQLLSVPYALHAETAQSVTNAKNIYNVVDFGAYADNTNATATTTAVQNAVDACIAAGNGVVYFPVGTFALNSTIDVALASALKSIKIVGEGTGLTKLVFQSGASDGLNITFSNGALMDGYKGSIIVRDFTISCIGSDQGGAAIKLTGSGSSSPMPGKEVNNIVINGIGSSDCWSYGVRVINATYTKVYDINYGGPATANSVATHLGTAISIESDNGAVDYFIRNCHITHADIGINILSNGANGAEGVYIDQCAMVFVNCGIKWIAPSSGKEPWLYFSGSHINAMQYNIYAQNLIQAQISGNLLYQNSNFVDDWIGIFIDNTFNAANNDLIHINNNTIHGFKNLSPTSQAIKLVKCGTASINDNLIFYCKRGIDYTTDLYDANIVFNKFIDCDLGINGASVPSASVVTQISSSPQDLNK